MSVTHPSTRWECGLCKHQYWTNIFKLSVLLLIPFLGGSAVSKKYAPLNLLYILQLWVLLIPLLGGSRVYINTNIEPINILELSEPLTVGGCQCLVAPHWLHYQENGLELTSQPYVSGLSSEPAGSLWPFGTLLHPVNIVCLPLLFKRRPDNEISYTLSFVSCLKLWLGRLLFIQTWNI